MTEHDLLLEMYKLQISRMEHFERLRASLSTLLLAIAAALLGLSGSMEGGSASVLIVSACVFLLGLFGYFAATRHAERAQRHGKRARLYRLALYEKFENVAAAGLGVKSKSSQLNRLWAALHIGVMVMGVILAFVHVL